MGAETDSRQKKPRTRSPAYPYLDLRQALEKAALLWRVEGRHAASVGVAMQHWGYKAESSTGYSCVAALKKFGLVDEEGIGESRQIKLSPLALGILLDEDPRSPERVAGLRTAALNPRIHAELWERYGQDLPSDPSLKRFLILEKNFNEAAVDEFLEEYKITITFAGLTTGGSEAANGRGAGPAALVTPGHHPPRRGGTERERLEDLFADREPAGGATGKGADRADRAGRAGRDEAAGGREAEKVRSPSGGYHGNGRAALNAGPAWGGSNRSPGQLPSPTPRPGANGPGPGAGTPRGEAPDPRGRPETGELDLELGRPARDEAAAAPPTEGPRKPRRELPVPLDDDMVARVPYPMTEEDFSLLIETLQLWKKRLVRPREEFGQD